MKRTDKGRFVSTTPSAALLVLAMGVADFSCGRRHVNGDGGGSETEQADGSDTDGQNGSDPNDDVECLMMGAYPSTNWTFSVGERVLVSNTAGVPDYIWRWYPDGHISTLSDGKGGYMMFWALSVAWRTVGVGPFPESMTRSEPNHIVFGGQFDETAWDNGGSWLMSVLRLPSSLNKERLIGFYHAEDHFHPFENPENIAWKSIGVTFSNDNGLTWETGTQIMTAHLAKPEVPEWGGAGDNSAVWDCKNSRYLMYYSEKSDDFKISAAATNDRNGLQGWQKWNGKGFDSPGIGGPATPLPGLSSQPGANPSVQWNTLLEKWILVWHGWNGNIYLSSSADGINWDIPRFVAGPENNRVHAWYPTLIDATGGDAVGGQTVRLYYADIASDVSERDFVYRTVTFYRND